MKKINFYFYSSAVALLMSVMLFSCKDEYDTLGSEADIISSFSVKSRSGTTLMARILQDSIIIKVSPYLDAKEELDSVVPVFYLSKGATVAPDPWIPQDFGKDGGVRYTVTSQDGKTSHTYTVTWGVSDKMAYGDGFSYAEVGTAKLFPELGYPGTQGNFDLPAIQYGDLEMYHAYCGDNIVLLSRAYIRESTSSPHCIKVVNKLTLEPAGTLNTGSINIANLKMITSDYKGRCVGAVTSGTSSEVFYWESTTSAPVSIGTIGVNLAMSNSDLCNNFQVAGDIKGDAWITALAMRDKVGTHYRIKVTGGRMASEYSTITTGYASDDCVGFQMISPFDDSDEPNFFIGDTEGTAAAANSIHCYVNTFAGSTIAVMPALWQNTLQAWWVGTGFTTSRTGGRAPVVNGMVVNGKTYALVTSGTGWWHAAAVLSTDLQTLAHANLNIAFAVNRGWSFGSWADWYWNEEAGEAYMSLWFGRLGLYTYKLTCFE